MDKEKLQKILESHKLWLAGGAGERADLSDADLSYADLSDANLGGAVLRHANLRGAVLKRAGFVYANLGGANLRDASLGGANLRSAYLVGANLSGASLGGANLRDANLSDANLRSAYLIGASLGGANLLGADLGDVRYNEKTAFVALQCPEEGSFVAWKKCENDVLVKLLIPEDAKRSSSTSRRCRASKAIVLEVIGAEKAISISDEDFVYEVGKEVVPDSFDDDRWNECSHGIHFFITRKEAENY